MKANAVVVWVATATLTAGCGPATYLVGDGEDGSETSAGPTDPSPGAANDDEAGSSRATVNVTGNGTHHVVQDGNSVSVSVEDVSSNDGSGNGNGNGGANRGYWTVMVYLSGDNDLDPFALLDLEEMQAVGSTDQVNVVVQIDRFQGPAYRLHVKPNGHEILQRIGEPDMGDRRTLRNFATWAMSAFPARHYALIVWDPGAEWRSASSGAPAFQRAFSRDHNGTANGISVAGGEYELALAGITRFLHRNLDLVAFDASLMGMWEVADVSADYADYLVASSEVGPEEAWPYKEILESLTATPSMTPAEFGAAIVRAYHAASPDNETLAVTDLSAIAPLGQSLSRFGDVASADPALLDVLADLRNASQSFADLSSIDIRSFAALAAADPALPTSVHAAATELVSALDDAVLLSLAQSSTPNAHGLAAFFPPRGTAPDTVYESAPWSTRWRWDEFLRFFVQ